MTSDNITWSKIFFQEIARVTGQSPVMEDGKLIVEKDNLRITHCMKEYDYSELFIYAKSHESEKVKRFKIKINLDGLRFWDVHLYAGSKHLEDTIELLKQTSALGVLRIKLLDLYEQDHPDMISDAYSVSCTFVEGDEDMDEILKFIMNYFGLN